MLDYSHVVVQLLLVRLEDLLLLVCDGKGVVVIRVLVEWFIVFVRSLGAP